MQVNAVGSNTTSYTWDFENRLTSVTLPGTGGTVAFKYDPTGRRIYKSLSIGGTSVFAYDGENMIEETNSSGTVVARYTQTENIDEPLAMLRSSATSYYNADGLGTFTSLANGSGALTQTYTFDSFGKQTASSGSVVNPFQYSGREYDTETGLYYYRARYYDPTIGRFIGEDPLRFGIKSKITSANLPADFYSYVANSPLNIIDPLGLWQVAVGGGDGVGILITFGYNSGQFNLGFYGGAGAGVFGSLDLTDSGCHAQGFVGGARGEGDVGVRGTKISVGLSGEVDTNGDKSASVTIPGPKSTAAGLTVPLYPSGPPRGTWGGGIGGFVGLGGTSYSRGSGGSCPCRGN
jgi:RHS repeat-associated protein